MLDLTICWSINSVCNMNCYYCFSRYDNKKEYNTSDRIIDCVFDKLKECTERYTLRLVVLGGEPTLHPRIYDICRNALNMCRKVILVTNGTKPHVLDSLPDEISLDVSYHGQDVISFLENINRLKEKHMVQILCPLDSRKKNEIEYLYQNKGSIPFEGLPIVDNSSEQVLDNEFTLGDSIYYDVPFFNGIKTNLEIYNLNKFRKEEDVSLFFCKQPNIAISVDGFYHGCCKTGLKHISHIEEDKKIRNGLICNHRYCMENRGCMDFSGWRQDPDGFLPWHN